MSSDMSDMPQYIVEVHFLDEDRSRKSESDFETRVHAEARANELFRVVDGVSHVRVLSKHPDPKIRGYAQIYRKEVERWKTQ